MPLDAASSRIRTVPGHSHNVVRYVVTPEVASKALKIAKEKVGDHLKADGIVSLEKGSKLSLDATDQLGVVRVHGSIVVDALWGDKETRRFSATVDTNKHTMTSFRAY